MYLTNVKKSAKSEPKSKVDLDQSDSSSTKSTKVSKREFDFSKLLNKVSTWQIISAVLLVLAIVSFVVPSGASDSKGLSESKAKLQMEGLLEDLTQGNSEVKVLDVVNNEGMYFYDVSIGGQLGSLYTNKSFTYVFGLNGESPISLEEIYEILSQSPAPATPSEYNVDLSKGISIGSEDAPVVIVEFSDYECPFCAKFHTETFSQIRSSYVDEGLVRFVYMDFPIPSHVNAQIASEGARCANDQGKYWEMQDKIFTNLGLKSPNASNLKVYAQDLGLDMDTFNNCLDSRVHKSIVEENYRMAVSNGITGTPTFFINGQKVSGAIPFDSFKSIIDEFL